MKNNLIVILCFTAGIFCGTFANTTISTYCEKLPQFLLYALVIQVGLNLGANAELGKMVKDIRFSSLLLPFFTIIGTLVFSAAASLLLTSWNIYDCMAVGSGFAYYSLSSLLIVQLKEHQQPNHHLLQRTKINVRKYKQQPLLLMYLLNLIMVFVKIQK